MTMTMLSHRKLNVVIAHDYVQFGRQTSLFADIKCKTPLESNHAICSNVMPMYNEIQIPIRALIEVVLPLLNSHEYCQKEHLVFRGNLSTLAQRLLSPTTKMVHA